MTMQRENLGPFDRVWEDAPAVTNPSAVLEKARKAYEDRVANKLNDPDEPTAVIRGGECGDRTYTVGGPVPGWVKEAITPVAARTVDPLWDRYFELAFKECMIALRGAPNGLVDGTEPVTVEVAAGRLADRMLAERNKRLG